MSRCIFRAPFKGRPKGLRGLGFRGLGLRLWGLTSGVYGFSCRILGKTVWSLGFRVQLCLDPPHYPLIYPKFSLLKTIRAQKARGGSGKV